MAATRRLQKELGEIRSSANKSFRDVQVDESNLLVWQGLLVPEKSPYNKVRDLKGITVSNDPQSFVGCISDRHSIPPRVSLQATEGLLQNKDLSSQYRRERTGSYGPLIESS